MYKQRVDKQITGEVLRALIAIAEADPWLFLDEIAFTLGNRCGGKYTGKRCYIALKDAGYPLKNLRRVSFAVSSAKTS